MLSPFLLIIVWYLSVGVHKECLNDNLYLPPASLGWNYVNYVTLGFEVKASMLCIKHCTAKKTLQYTPQESENILHAFGCCINQIP